MPDKKLTDKEIVKALELCLENDFTERNCKHCPYEDDRLNCMDNMLEDTIDLINRLQADSKRLKKVQMQLDDALKMYHVIKAEAYKEFAEKYKDQIKNYTGMFTDDGFMVNLEAVLSAVDFVKERLVGDNNAE